MKKSIGLLMFAAAFFTAASAQALYTATVGHVDTKEFTISNVTIAASSSFTANTKKISDNSGSNTIFTFESVDTSARFSGYPNEYIAINVDDNAASWKLQIFSDDFVSAPSTVTYGFQYGGLIGDQVSYGTKVSMAWIASTMTVMNATGGPALGNIPGTAGSQWTFLKDVHDIDDPLAVVTSTTSSSWTNAQKAGYANIAYGSVAGTSVVTTDASGTGVMRPLKNRKDQISVYVRADFSLAPADKYHGTIGLELYHQ
jgi:hypothetical protein